MINITELPPQEIPTQLTAKVTVRKLGDHLAGFLASTNTPFPKYFEDPNYVLQDDKVADLLFHVACADYIDYKQAKLLAFKIRDITNRQLKLGNALELIARALGYRYWTQCVFTRDANDQIENVWGSELLKHETMFEDCKLTKSERREIFRNSRIQELISQNRHLHRK